MTMTVTHTQDADAYLTVSEASRIANLSADTLRRYGDSGKLPTYRTPANHRRFLESDIRALNALQSTPMARPVDDLPPVSAGRASSLSGDAA